MTMPIRTLTASSENRFARPASWIGLGIVAGVVLLGLISIHSAIAGPNDAIVAGERRTDAEFAKDIDEFCVNIGQANEVCPRDLRRLMLLHDRHAATHSRCSDRLATYSRRGEF